MQTGRRMQHAMQNIKETPCIKNAIGAKAGVSFHAGQTHHIETTVLGHLLATLASTDAAPAARPDDQGRFLVIVPMSSNRANVLHPPFIGGVVVRRAGLLPRG
jgi:hypothetical protein